VDDSSNLSAVLCDAQRLAQALIAANLSEKELHWLRATARLQYGTALRGAQAAGLGLGDVPPGEAPGPWLASQWSSTVGGSCHKIADALGWEKPSKGMWIDLLLTFERKRHYELCDRPLMDQDTCFTWSVRPQWSPLLV
jgi:hypothetical protein|tara:strand:+ start:16986 stop:17402 length:417 start_codon:yes stop_codon:yes gene_type:complete